MSTLPDFKLRGAEQRAALGAAGAARLLDAGRCWELAPALRAGGSLIFPHASIGVCGHQIAAVVHAVLDAGARRVIALGVLHGLTEALAASRARVAAGGDPGREAGWGIQGPGCARADDWRREFSLDHLIWLLEAECARRGVRPPALDLRFPFLAGAAPERLPGFGELAAAAREPGTVIVATGDLCHHGRGYGESAATALAPEAGGLALAREAIAAGFALLARAEYAAYQAHCVQTKSDARDTGQVLRALIGPFSWELLDLTADDMSGPYAAPSPTWVAAALLALRPAT